MSQDKLLKELASLTSSLVPGKKVKVDDLHEVRCLLARFLNEEEGAQSGVPSLKGKAELSRYSPELEELSEDLRMDLNSALDEYDRLRNAVKNGERPEEELGVRVYRRELPILTNDVVESMPSWAAGRRVDRTIGPFLDRLDRPYWFDIYFPVQQVSVIRLPSRTPFLRIPLTGFSFSNSNRYKLPAGSIWILSKLLSPSAPAGTYTGLKIKKGSLELSSPATVHQGLLQVSPRTRVTLKIELDPPPPGSTTLGPGVDASESEVYTPAKATFVFTLEGGEILHAADAKVAIYNNGFHTIKASEMPTYEPLINRILVPFDTEGDLEIKNARSKLFFPKGKTKVVGAAWALPVTEASPDSLGEAAGAGGMVIFTKKGLHASWRGLKGRPVSLGTMLFAEPGRLEIIGEQTSGPDSSQKLELWEESGGSNRRSLAELSYEHPFVLRFYSDQQSEQEALLVNGSLRAKLDRPICSDSLPLPIHSENATLRLFEDKSGFSCMLYSLLPIKSSSIISLALRNALIKTKPPGEFAIQGRFKDADPTKIYNGGSALYFIVQYLIPYLPDPYAANMVISYAEGSKAALRFDPSDVGGMVITEPVPAILAAYTLWSRPDKPELFLQMFNVPNLLPTKRTNITVPPHDLAQEDAEKLSSLRRIFDETAGGGIEVLKLLDVSTNADHLGIGFGVAPRKKKPDSEAPILQIQGIDLVSAGRNIKVLTTPQVQWEPVITDPNPDGFPSPLFSAGDGGPTLIGANSVTLVPVAPRPVLSQIVNEFNQESGSVPAAALLPYPSEWSHQHV
jgi:hypothetical protein